MELLPCILIPLAGLLSLATTVFWAWMLVDCASKERSEGDTRLVWVLIIALTHVIGALLYFLIRRPQRQNELGV